MARGVHRGAVVAALLVLALCLPARPAQAQTQTPVAAAGDATRAPDGLAGDGDTPVDARDPWALGAALVAGPLAHGAGHLVAGQRRTGLRLLAAEGLGALALVGGIAGLAVTGASEKTVAPLIGLSGLGMGLFTTSLLADIYGVSTPPGGLGTAVARPALVAEAGLRHVQDPVFDYDALGYIGARAFVGRQSLSLQTHLGLDHDNQRLRAIYANRFVEWGPATYLEAELGGVHHRFAPEQFSMSFAEAALAGRLGLQRIGPTLQGAFVDAALGVAFGAHRYFGIETESDGMLLMRLGFGLFVGDGGSLRLYYDHRHDGYAAGMKVPGLGSGPLGHVGAALDYYVSETWGASLLAEGGSAYVLGLSLLYRRKRW